MDTRVGDERENQERKSKFNEQLRQRCFQGELEVPI